MAPAPEQYVGYSPDNAEVPRVRTLRSLLKELFPTAEIVEDTRQKDVLHMYECVCSGNKLFVQTGMEVKTPSQPPQIQVLIEGITLPLETPLSWIYDHFRQIDGFLYLVTRLVKFHHVDSKN